MNNVNIVVVEGRLTADPEIVVVGDKREYIFTLANSRYYFKDQNLVDEISHFTVKVDGLLAVKCSSETLFKDRLVLVSGNMRTKDGAMYIEANNIKFLGQRRDING